MSWFARRRKATGRLAVALGPDQVAYALADAAHAPGTSLRRAGVLHRGADTPEQFARRLKDLKLGAREVIAVLAAPQYQLLQIEAPAVPGPELRAAARWRIKDMVDAHIDDLTLDVLKVGDDRARAQQHLFVVAAANAAIAATTQACGNADLPLTVIDIRETAQRNLQTALADLAGVDAQATAALVVDGTQCLLTISAHGELFYTRRLAWDDRLLQARPSAAPRETAPDADYALDDGAYAPAFDDTPELVIELQRSMDVWERSWPSLPLALLFVHAGLATDALVERLESELGLPVRPMRLASLFPALDDLGELPEADREQCLPVLGALLRSEARAL